MRRSRIVLACGALACFGTAASAGAQPTPPIARLMSIPSDSVEFMVGGQIVSLVDRRPVPGVQVYLEGTRIGALTDGRGRFRIDGTDAGSVRLRTRIIGFDSICVNIELFADLMQSVRISLPPSRSRIGPRLRLCGDPEIVEPPDR